MRAELSLSVLALVGTLLAPATAGAFCRTRTVPVPPDFTPPGIEGAGCFDQGLPLYHPSQCIPYRLLAKDSAVLPRSVLSASLARAFAAWSAPSTTCVPGFSAIELAPTSESTIVSYRPGQRDQNIIGIVDGPWPHAGAENTLALSTLMFSADTGEIVNVDVEIQSNIDWSVTAVPKADGYDLDAAMTHEMGHFLGLAHTGQPDAAMYASYTPGSASQRALSLDDQRAICAVYPDRQTRVAAAGNVAATPCDLSAGAPGACGDSEVTHGCSVASAPGSSARNHSWGACLVGVVALLAVLRSGRRRGRERSSA